MIKKVNLPVHVDIFVDGFFRGRMHAVVHVDIFVDGFFRGHMHPVDAKSVPRAKHTASRTKLA
jgi:hypothetical protein